MINGREIAKRYLRLMLNPVPVANGSKIPLRENHSSIAMTEEEIDDYDFENIGISTGIVSGGLEAIDFDLKNSDDPKKVMEVFKSKLPKQLIKKLVVQQTQSKGYHMIYRCEDISSSKKLAKNKNGEAIIETRGEGGYIKCAPSEGYKIIQGSLDKIPIISPEERNQLFLSAKMLNELIIKESKKKLTFEDNEYIQKFPDYNEDIQIGIDLLLDNGWTLHRSNSDNDVWINMSRPNTKSGDIHGGYHKEGKFFYCFSSAQDNFELERPYNNHALFAELVCEGNYKVAYGKLYDMGYGNEEERHTKTSAKELSEKDWATQLEELTFLSDETEENTYLEQARKGEVQLGLTTGWDELDEYMRLKENSLNFGLGYDGVGKSVMMLSLAMASNIIHDWKWGMIMPENRTAMSRRRLVECMTGRSVDSFNNEGKLFQEYLKKVRDNFKIISNKKHYALSDVLEMGKRLYEYYGIKALLIDPYNFFKVSGNAYSHNNDILSEMRVFAEQYCSIYVMAHPSSNAPRTNKDKEGFLQPPSKYDIQGGADFPYRVDDFFIFHRLNNHPDPEIRRSMQIIMEKVKEEETGGKRHNSGEFTSLIWEERDGFLGYWDDRGNNPMNKAIVSKMGVRAQAKTIKKGISPEEAFLFD